MSDIGYTVSRISYALPYIGKLYAEADIIDLSALPYNLHLYAGAHTMDQIARTPVQLGAALRRQRKQLGLSQAEVGQRINLRQATISALEGGEVDTKLTTLLDALAALNLELVVRPRSSGDSADIEALF